ncbi:MAG TPA: HNH endonuclease [Bacteroidales bacterium]|nr:HNH endonuclease [Bacteroidales bacterium]HRZ77039.1 HNH endonuclease [Bacteroidales bacterium]
MDDLIRMASFDWLEKQRQFHGDVMPRRLLEAGFEFQGQRITLIGPSGIWKPKMMELPISITTIPNGTYKDGSPEDGLIEYCYRGTDIYHPDNVGLRRLMQEQKPVFYFRCLTPGRYFVAWPVYIVGDDPNRLMFTVAVEDQVVLREPNLVAEPQALYRRSYLTSTMKVRLHQQSFRERVLRAYSNQCALCRLKHPELLDAAHIIGDRDDFGDPVVQNGLSLCKIHHAAFDRNILGVSPDYIIKVREDILEEIDGPMLKYGLQSLENNKISLPTRRQEWPDRERLETRFGEFLRAG